MTATATPPRAAALKTYHATDNGNGTFTIHDVEIVGPVAAGHRPDSVGAAPAIGRAWMERVVATHLEQLVTGYAAPLHAEHHGSARSPALGTFVPLRVRKQRYEGEDVDMIVGDLTVDSATLAAIQRGEYPYRSIEVERWSFGLIASLALMSSTPPYSRLPMLRNVVVSTAPVPAGAEALAAQMAAVLHRYPRRGFAAIPATLRARTIARLAYAKSGEDEDGAPAEDGDEPEADAGGDAPFAKNEAEGGGDEGGGFDEGAGSGSGGGELGAEAPAPKWAAAIMKLLARIAEAVMGGGVESDHAQPAHDESPTNSGDMPDDEDEEEDERKPDSPKEKADMAAATVTLDAATKATLAALTADNATLKAQMATLTADNATLKASLAAAEAKAKAIEFTTAARATLRAKRVVIPADFDATVAKLHAAGEDLAKSFVATLESTGRMDPPDTLTDELGLAGSVADEPEVLAYVKFGTAKLEAARKVAREYRTLKAQVPGSATTLAEMLAINPTTKVSA